MNRNRILLLIAFALAGLTTWLILREPGKGKPNAELRDFAVADTASITKIFLADNTPRSVTLTREADGRWKVDGKYYARPDAVKTLLSTVHDISVREPVGLKARQTVVKQLITGSTKIEIYAGEQLIKQYYVGKETADMQGTYMLLTDVSDPEEPVNSTEPFIMEIKGFSGYLTPRYFTNAIEWRDRTAFRYFAPDIRSIKVTHGGEFAGSSFIVTQTPGNKFSLQKITGEPLPFDTIAVKQYISYFGNIGFENFVTDMPKATKDSILASPPAHMITVTDAANKKTEIKLFVKKNDGEAPMDTTAAMPPEFDPDRMYGQLGTGEMVIVQYYVFGKLLQTPEYFLPEKK